MVHPYRSLLRRSTLPRILTSGESHKRMLQGIFFLEMRNHHQAFVITEMTLWIRDLRYQPCREIFFWNQGRPVSVRDGGDLEGSQDRRDSDPH